MPVSMLWFDRKFPVDLGLELAPGLIERLRGTPARLEDRLHNADSSVLVARRDGKWSIQENVGHLIDCEPLWQQRVADFAGGAPELTPADLGNRRTHEANHNARALSLLLAEFREARGRLLASLEAQSESFWSRVSQHPRLKTAMRPVDFLNFVAEHDDHHLARIHVLLKQARRE